MRPIASKRFWIPAALAFALFMGAAFLVVQHEVGYFSPVISPDGQFVYFVRRSTSGLVWGLGWEFFTPPAHAFLWQDRFALCRTKIDGSSFEVLHRLPASPLERRTIQEYRGRMFTVPTVVLRFEDSRLQVQIAISVPQQPFSDTSVLRGEWSEQDAPATLSAWAAAYPSMSPGEDVLREPWEVLAVPGREGYPCAVTAYNDRTSEVRVLKATAVCNRLYSAGIRWEHLAQQSRREDIRRLRHLRQLRAELVSSALAEGLPEGSALLQSDHSLEEMGTTLKPPQLVAYRLGSGKAKTVQPLFTITEMEFKVGLFPDIEQALAVPGNEIEKSMGQYIVHRDYTTSRRLNEFLDSGGKTFYVERSGTIYELRLTDSRPAYR